MPTVFISYLDVLFAEEFALCTLVCSGEEISYAYKKVSNFSARRTHFWKLAK